MESINSVSRIVDCLLVEHHCSATYEGSVRITHTHKNRVLWKGTVGIFKLQGHPHATIAYAWINDELLGLSAPQIYFQSKSISSPSAAITAHLRESIQQIMHV